MTNMLRATVAIAVLFVFGTESFGQIRINEIGTNGVEFGGATKWVELYNAGDSEEDVGEMLLCDFPLYPMIGSLTPLGGGSTNIPAGGYLVVAWTDLDMDADGDAEIGLYMEGTGDFGNSSAMKDYVQYGEAGHFREVTAVAANLWTTGEFVPAAESGMSLQLIDAGATGAANWVARPATPNMANGLATAVEGTETPEKFVLYDNFPNPFNPSTTISYDLGQAGSVSLDIFDMLGQKITSLFEGGQPAGSYSFTWDGRDARGNVVSSGVYFYRLVMDGRISQSRVMTLLK